MPYKRQGKKILVNKGGVWKKQQTCKSINNAKAALRLLREKTGH